MFAHGWWECKLVHPVEMSAEASQNKTERERKGKKNRSASGGYTPGGY